MKYTMSSELQQMQPNQTVRLGRMVVEEEPVRGETTWSRPTISSTRKVFHSTPLRGSQVSVYEF